MENNSEIIKEVTGESISRDYTMEEHLDAIFNSEESNEQKRIWLKNLLYTNDNEYVDANWRILSKFKDLQGLEYASEDIIYKEYIEKAEKSIQSYLNYKSDEFKQAKEDFVIQIADLAKYYYRNKDNVGINQMSQGSRSVSYTTKGIPQEIKDSLPLPRIRVVG